MMLDSNKTMGNATDQVVSSVFNPQLEAAYNLWKYCSPLLILLGTFGNVLTIFVLTRKSMWKMSSSPYLVVLSFADIAVLYTGLLRQWIRYFFDLDFRMLSPMVCKLHIFVVYLSLDFSVWILVSVSFERFVFVCFPFKAKTLCTRKRAKTLMVIIFMFLSLLNCHFLYGYESAYNEDSTLISHCEYKDMSYEFFMDQVWPWIDLSVFSMVPFCIILVCNISLIARITRSHRLKKAASTDEANNQRVKPSSMTALLVSLNTLFLATTAPISIYLIGYAYWIASATEEVEIQLTVWWAIVNQLQYLNNSVNFLFYCITGPKFRKELKGLCGRNNAVEDNVTITQTGPPGVSLVGGHEQTTHVTEAV